MAAPDIYNIQTTQSNTHHSNAPKSDICYLPSAPMQGISQPLYPMPGQAPLLYPVPQPAVAPPSYPMTSPPPPPYAMPQPVQQPGYPPPQVLVTQMQVPYQGVIIAGHCMPPQTAHINDYMIWSIFNIFMGGFLLGIIAVILSSQTRKRKMEGDVEGARTMSKLALICNILITIIFFGLTAFLVIFYVITLSSITAYS